MSRKGLFAAAAAFAASPKGRRLLQQAVTQGQSYLQSPKGQATVQQLKNATGSSRRRQP